MSRAILLASILALIVPPAFCQQENALPISTFEGGAQTGLSYQRKAEYLLNNGNIEGAIKLCQAALKADNDTDLHQVYAQALERKLKLQRKKDPHLFILCVSEWLKVLRQEGGQESMTFHGLGIPLTQKFYEDEDRVMPAKQHVLKLAGRLPKPWETDTRFLDRLQKSINTEVHGSIVNKANSSDGRSPDGAGFPSN